MITHTASAPDRGDVAPTDVPGGYRDSILKFLGKNVGGELAEANVNIRTAHPPFILNPENGDIVEGEISVAYLKDIKMPRIRGLEEYSAEVGWGKRFRNPLAQSLFYLGLPTVASYGDSFHNNEGCTGYYDDKGNISSTDQLITIETSRGGGDRRVEIKTNGPTLVCRRSSFYHEFVGFGSSIGIPNPSLKLSLHPAESIIVVTNLSQQEIRQFYKEGSIYFFLTLAKLIRAKRESQVYGAIRGLGDRIRSITNQPNATVYGFPHQLLVMPNRMV